MRNRTIDIARGIGILSIIIGHFGIRSITRVVYTYHIPIFYIFTGYFLKREGLLSFTKRKARNLLVPYVLTCGVVIGGGLLFQGKDIGLDWVLASFYGAGSEYKSPVQPIGAIWFLWSTFWGSIFLQVSLRLKPFYRIACIIILFVLGYATSKVLWLPFSIQAGCCAVLFMYVGYCLRQCESFDIPSEVKLFSIVAAFLVWITFIYSFHSFYLVRNDFGRGTMDIAASLCGCYCIVIIARRVNDKLPCLAMILSCIGRYSIVILCVHLVEMNLVDWWMVVKAFESFKITFIIAEFLAVLLKIMIIFGFTYLISKSKRIGHIFSIK